MNSFVTPPTTFLDSELSYLQMMLMITPPINVEMIKVDFGEDSMLLHDATMN